MQAFSTIPPSFPSAKYLARYVLHPYGRGQGMSYTISLYDTGIPDANGHPWIGYRLYEHTKGGARKGTVLFQGTRSLGSKDSAEAARLLLDELTVRPGDLPDDPTRHYSPDQLAFAVTHADALRKEARNRLGWSDKVLGNLRGDLELHYSSRKDPKAPTRHRFDFGVLAAEGKTKGAARDALAQAIGHHASALPTFSVGRHTGQVYVLRPHGSEWEIQTIHPQFPDSPVGDVVRFTAESQIQAQSVLSGLMERTERPAAKSRILTQAASVRPPAPSKRPSRVSIRANA